MMAATGVRQRVPWRVRLGWLDIPASVKGGTSQDSAAVATTVERALHRGAMVGLLGAHVAMASLIAFSPTARSLIALIAAHAVLAVLSGAAVIRRINAPALLTATYVLLLADCAVPTSSLVPRLATWTLVLALAAPALLLGARAAALFAGVSAAWLLGAALVAGSQRHLVLELTTVILGLATLVGAIALMHGLRQTAARMDGAFDTAQLEWRRLAVERRAGRDAAEDARTVHDTIINTLGAIANGVSDVADLGLVRARAQADVNVLTALLHGSERDLGDPAAYELARAAQAGWLRAATPEVSARLAAAPAPVRRALRAVVAELLRNVTKHAAATDVVVEARAVGEGLEISVTDDGVGFDPLQGPGSGLAESVIARCAEVDVDIMIDSAPGAGTRAVVAWAPSARESATVTDGAIPGGIDVSGLVRAAGWAWTRMVALAGIASLLLGAEPVRGNAWMLAVILAGVAVLWWASRHGREPGVGALLLAVIAVPAALVLGVRSMSVSGEQMHYWQVLALTPVLLVIASVSSARWPVPAAVVALVIGTLASAALPAKDSSIVALLIGGGLLQLCMLVGWITLARSAERIAARLDAERRELAQKRLESEAMKALRERRARWSATSLESCLDLLRRIATGACDVTSATVRAECSREEHHLRQLTKIDPELRALAGHLGEALDLARKHGVRLTLNAGSADVADERTASALGDLIAAAVRGIGSGSDLTVSLNQAVGGPQLRFLCARGALACDELQPLVPTGWRVTHTAVGHRDLIELAPITTADLATTST